MRKSDYMQQVERQQPTMNGSRAPTSVIDEDRNMNSIYGGSWLVDRVLWCSNPSNASGSIHSFSNDEAGSYEKVRDVLKVLVGQLNSSSEEVRQMTAGVLRSLTWAADQSSQKALRDVGAVAALMKAAMESRNESTLRSILAALWNLSAHCSMNKADICLVDGGLAFLVTTLIYRSSCNSHAIVESGGGILRNISSHIAVREDYRAILRENNCLVILLQHLRSSNLTIVSHACGALWNLSARCTEDQRILWELGAVSILKNLVNSKHKMISMGSSAALKNLLQARSGSQSASVDKLLSNPVSSLRVRKPENYNLAERYESLNNQKRGQAPHYLDRKLNIDESTENDNYRPVGTFQLHGRMYDNIGNQLSSSKVVRCRSKDSVATTKSDSYQYRSKSLNTRVRNRQSHPVSDNEDAKGERAAKVQAMLESRSRYVMPQVTRRMTVEGEEHLGKWDSMSSRILKNVNVKHLSEAVPQNDKSLLRNYSNITTMIEKLNLCDEEIEEPLDYSLKYMEKSKPSNKGRPTDNRDKINQNDNYSCYAETDLDGPDKVTNCGVKYVVNTVTTDNFRQPLPKDEKPYFAAGHYHAKDFSCHDDTVRTYCTEDTPLSFSTATSMTDLREIRDTKQDKISIPTIQETVNDSIVKYCVEDTPVCFSRVSSLSSLNSDSDDVNDHQKNVPANDHLAVEDASKTKPCIASSPKQPISTIPDKAVHFEEQLVEQTPLMFSRCSSMESLSSFDQNSIHDDRSSVISDFSRRASEVVSPSDLPDSPGEKTCTFTLSPGPGVATDPSKKLHVPNCKPSEDNEYVFEDSPRIYAVEGTPLQFSKATSLSSLPTTPPADMDNSRDENRLDDLSLEDYVSDLEEDGEDLLAACINSAMPNNNHRHSPKKRYAKRMSTVNDLNKNINKNNVDSRFRTKEISIKCNNLSGPAASTSKFDVVGNMSDYNSQDSNTDTDSFDDDSMLTQCIQSGMPSPVPSKLIGGKEQPYVPNLNRKSATSMASAMENSKTSHSGSSARLFNVMKTRTDNKSLAYKSHNTNAELNSSKRDNISKPSHSKAEFKPRERTPFHASFSSNAPRGGRANEEEAERFLQFQVENTPIYFSDNSSLSSLSMDSCGLDTAASDQALLEVCISSGMPSKSQSMQSKPSLEGVKKKSSASPRVTESQQKTAICDQKKGVNRSTSTSGSQSKHAKVNKLPAQQSSNSIDTEPPQPPVRQTTFTKEEPSPKAVPKVSSMKTKIPTYGSVNSQFHRLTPPPARHTEEKQLAAAASKNMSLQSKISGRRGQSLSPVLRNLNSSRVLSKNSPISTAGKKTPISNMNKSGTLERNVRWSPVPSKNYHLDSPKRSSSNASLCSSTCSSTTSAKSSDNRTGKKKDVSKTNSRLNGIWKANKVQNAASSSPTQSQKDSTNEKLKNKVRPDAEGESSPSNLNQNSPTTVKRSTSTDANSVQSPDDDGKQSCLVTYL